MAILLMVSALMCLFGITSCYPPTCYTKVLSLGKEITERAQSMRSSAVTERCASDLPKIYIDVHNSCVMPKMRGYLTSLESLGERHCLDDQKVQAQMLAVRRLYLIMAQRCHGELVFYRDDCAELERKATHYT
ncbi:CYTL1 domain-containing protein isoform X1 [Polypterus senegalus]|uniref:CYTL1 domain-containing protein isoform X1 n=1 Tax=Polypterus senegalus TaxID=55291 RepID=UPI001964D294|nr:CYTL1 domain-containing protein isoform X1 [Polypterus senegalus]